MKITKSQLKQIIKEELNEAWDDNEDEWLDHLSKDSQGLSPLDKSPRSKMMGPSPIAGQEDPSDTEGGYTMSQESGEEDPRAVDDMISFYQENPRYWYVAEDHYRDMAQGKDPEGIRSEMYPDWSDEDFAEVIRAISPGEEY